MGTEQRAVMGVGPEFATSLNRLLADGWRVVPGTLAGAPGGSQPVFCAVVERAAPAPAAVPASEPAWENAAAFGQYALLQRQQQQQQQPR
jgi:hypothetical protein